MRAPGRIRLVAAGVALALLALVPAEPGAAAPARTRGIPAPSTTVDVVLGRADLTRPRLLMRRSDVPVVQDRLTREPYKGLLKAIQSRIDSAPPASAADPANCLDSANISRESQKDRAAMDLSFLYLVDRVYDPGTDSVVTPDPAGRQAIGDRVRDYLRFLCPRSRIEVSYDRDISSSHELLSAAVAYDDLLGGGYDLGTHEGEVVGALSSLTRTQYEGYTTPDSPNGNLRAASLFDVNNHRSKGAASIGTGALALAGTAGVDQAAVRRWLDFGLERVDLVEDWTYGAGDGGYGESAFYWRFAMTNIVPFEHAWDRISGGATITTAGGITVPSLWRSPKFALRERWLLDVTVPNGSLATFDDGKVGTSGYFGLFPADFPEASALGWRWANSPSPYEAEENIDMAPFSIVSYDDSVPLAPPTGSPTRFYTEGGNVIFRSDWSPNATEAIIQGEHGAAREMGLTRDGTGELFSAAHDHPDPGAVQLYSGGERLLLDPGYLDFPWSRHFVMNKGSDHNIVLVDPLDAPASPVDPFAASAVGPAAAARNEIPGAPTPADGDATISDTSAGKGLDAATVTSRYGASGGASALVQRRFLFVDDQFVIAADAVSSPVARTYTWPVLGNGGGSAGTLPAQPATSTPPEGATAIPATPYAASGGSFTQTASGGQWDRPGARLTTGLAFDSGVPTANAADGFYEQDRNSLAQYTGLYTSVQGTDVRALTVHYPTPEGQAAPTIDRVPVPGASALRVTDTAGDKRVFVINRAPGRPPLTLDGATTGVGPVTVTGTLMVVETHLDGTLVSAYTEGATALTVGGTTFLTATSPSTLGIRLAADGTVGVTADPVDRPKGEPAGHDAGAASGDPIVVHGLPFTPQSVDGGCRLAATGADATVAVSGDRTVVLHPDGAGGLPAADPGVAQRVDVGATATLSAGRSCSPDGSALTPHWSITSAPSGSAWQLTGDDTLAPVLLADKAGVYRVHLSVTDDRGRTSREVEHLVFAGPAGSDGVDNDLDGTIDDEGTTPPPPPPTTPPPTVPVTPPPGAAPTDGATTVPAGAGPLPGDRGAATSPGASADVPSPTATPVEAVPAYTG